MQPFICLFHFPVFFVFVFCYFVVLPTVLSTFVQFEWNKAPTLLTWIIYHQYFFKKNLINQSREQIKLARSESATNKLLTNWICKTRSHRVNQEVEVWKAPTARLVLCHRSVPPLCSIFAGNQFKWDNSSLTIRLQNLDFLKCSWRRETRQNVTQSCQAQTKPSLPYTRCMAVT